MARTWAIRTSVATVSSPSGVSDRRWTVAAPPSRPASTSRATSRCVTASATPRCGFPIYSITTPCPKSCNRPPVGCPCSTSGATLTRSSSSARSSGERRRRPRKSKLTSNPSPFRILFHDVGRSPVCLDRPIYPCRGLCERVRVGCEGRMKTYGYPWPDMLRCDKFPMDNDMCIGPLNGHSGSDGNTLLPLLGRYSVFFLTNSNSVGW